MPIRIRWKSKEYFGIGLLLLGMCGMLQLFFIFIGQYFLEIGNYFVVILIPLGMTVANFFAAIVIFESFAQVERREKLRSQFRKSKIDVSNLEKFLNFPVTKPLIIVSIIFVSFFFTTFYISATFLPNTISFIVAENTSAIICLLIANLIEKKYGRVQRF
ncbi:hypothetical protein LCGC14_1157980 [marine sediment metagenome]|uniref:Uncharacterized protein n=1 Tax=marine sediment metagenome TaxID=412755 RepID=A0A0F9PZ11_9ZZZZ